MCLVLYYPDWGILRYGAGTGDSHSPQHHLVQSWAVRSGWSCSVNELNLRLWVISFGKFLFILQNQFHVPPSVISLSLAAFTGKADLEARPPVSQPGHTRLMKIACTCNIVTSSVGLWEAVRGRGSQVALAVRRWNLQTSLGRKTSL